MSTVREPTTAPQQQDSASTSNASTSPTSLRRKSDDDSRAFYRQLRRACRGARLWIASTLLGWEHSRFVWVARSEAQLWDRVWPRFKEYLSGDPEKRFPELRELYLSYRRIAIKIWAKDYIRNRYARLAVLSSITIAFLGLPLITGSWLLYITTLIVGFLGAIATELLADWLGKRPFFPARYALGAPLLAIIEIVLGYFLVRAVGWPIEAILTHRNELSFQDSIAYMPVIVGAFELSAIIWRIARMRFDSALMAMPDVAILSYIFDVADDMEDADAFVNYSDRRRVFRYLDVASKLLSPGVPKQLRLPDPAHRATFEERCRSASLWLRQLIIWAALPNPRTHEDISSSCFEIGYILITGQYDQLPEMNASKPTGKQRLHEFISVLRVLLSGAVPALVLVGVKRLGVDFDGSWLTASTVFCVAWAAVTYLQLLDPIMGQRISTIRDLVGAVRGNPSSSEKAK